MLLRKAAEEAERRRTSQHPTHAEVCAGGENTAAIYTHDQERISPNLSVIYSTQTVFCRPYILKMYL